MAFSMTHCMSKTFTSSQPLWKICGCIRLNRISTFINTLSAMSKNSKLLYQMKLNHLTSTRGHHTNFVQERSGQVCWPPILKRGNIINGQGQRCCLHLYPSVLYQKLSGKSADSGKNTPDSAGDTGWVIRLANENGYLSWCRNTYLATVVGVGMWAEGPSVIAFHATEGALFLGGLNLVLGTVSYLHTILRLRKKIHMSVIGASLHTLAALCHLGIWLTVVITYLGYVESEEEVRHPASKSSLMYLFFNTNNLLPGIAVALSWNSVKTKLELTIRHSVGFDIVDQQIFGKHNQPPTDSNPKK